MKRIIAIVISVLLIVGQTALSADITNSEAYFEITSLGIMVGDEEGNLNLDKPLTRAEFAAVITRLIGLNSSIGMSGIKSFTDVLPSDWFAGYVGLMYDMGIMNGVSETQFSPDTYVTYEQTMKTLVCVLGYENAAKNSGGYPDGYIKMGTKLRLNANMDLFSEFTRGDIMQMCYNAMDVQMLTESEDVRPTLREIHSRSYDGIYRSTGVVSANFETYLNAPNSSLEINEVEIDDVVYRIGETDANLYLGQMVEFYAMEDEDGVRDVLVSVRPYRNNITELLWSDVEKADLSEIQYRADDKRRTAKISGAKLIKNGRIVLAPNDADVSAHRGTVRLIDYDNNNIADVVFIDDYENVRVKTVTGDVIEYADGFSYKGSRFLNVDLEDEDVHYTVLNSDGTPISLEEIKEDDILSISSDPNGEVYRIVVSQDRQSGEITEIGEEEILVNGRQCRLYTGDSFAINAGDNVDVYLDYNGFVSDVEEAEEKSRYAYIVASGRKGAISSTLELKMIVGSKVAFTYEENTDNPDSTDLIPILECQNAAVEILTASDRMKVDGVRFEKDDTFRPGLYSYELNAEGEVKELVSATEAGGGKNMKYNTYDKTFWLDSRVPVGIDDDTVVVCLPKRDTVNGETEGEFSARLAQTSQEDYMVPLEISNKESSVSFEVFGYDLDTDTKKVNIVVFYETMKADNIVSVNTDTSPIGMVSGVKHSMDENGEYVPEISIITNSGTEQYLMSDIVSGKNDVLNTLRKGDLIYYEIGLSGKLDDAEVIYSFSGGIEPFSKNSGTANYQVCGAITDVLYDEIEATSGNLSTVLSVDTPSGIIPVTVYQRNKPQMFIYDRENGEITTAAMYDLLPVHDENFFALIPLGGKAKACVIYR